MQDDIRKSLETERVDVIKNLGYLCYNLHIDGAIAFPEMKMLVDEIKQCINSSRSSDNSANIVLLNAQQARLEEKISELGCICYNLYVDKKLLNEKILNLCIALSSINGRIVSGNGMLTDNIRERVNSGNEPISETNNVYDKFKVNCPYGMEPIPANYKRCVCGYRNRPEAVYCGRCGAKLN